MINTIYRPLLEAPSTLGIAIKIAKYERKHKTATFIGGELERLEDIGYIMSAMFEDPSAF